MKGLSYDVTEWPPPLHAPMQRMIFGARTVPGLKIDGEKISGSRTIMRRLEQFAPDPASVSRRCGGAGAGRGRRTLG